MEKPKIKKASVRDPQAVPCPVRDWLRLSLQSSALKMEKAENQKSKLYNFACFFHLFVTAEGLHIPIELPCANRKPGGYRPFGSLFAVKP
ncbi:MAG: hypothetical protein MUO53_13070 [Maribacter sp.]|nr:hypothetical protein [Maribacter sp.]